MKWLVGWIIVFVVSWGLGTVIFAIAIGRKDDNVTKFLAAFFFGLPVMFLGLDLFKQSMVSNNYEASVAEVKALCAKDGGDKIYKIVDNVQGVFQMRARKPASYLDAKGVPQQWTSSQYGMEDPYGWMQGDYGIEGNVGNSSVFPDAPPMGKQGYWFIEQRTTEGKGYRRSYLSPRVNKYNERQELSDEGYPLFEIKYGNVGQLKSRYGYLSEDLTTKEMRDKWIGAGRFKIIDLQTNEVLAERKGYFRASGDTLPSYGIRWSDSYECKFKNPHLIHFLHSVLHPPKDFPTKEQLELIAKE